MRYYISKKAGSMILKKKGADRLHLIAGTEIPADYVAELVYLDSLVAEGAIVALDDHVLIREEMLGKPDVNPIPVGVPDGDFMPEAMALPGKRKDSALEQLLAEQERRKAEAEVVPEEGGSKDGLVKVVPPPEVEDLEDVEQFVDELSMEEFAALQELAGAFDAFDDIEDDPDCYED